MGNIHVGLKSGNAYRLVMHIVTPIGNNSNGVAWSAVLKAALAPVSILPVGDQSNGTILSAESLAIIAGTTLEIVADFVPASDFESLTGAQQQAAVDAFYASQTADRIARLAVQLQRFGQVIT